MSSSHDITLTPQEQALIMRLKSFRVPEMAHILEEQLKDPNADLNTFMERMTAMIDAEWQARADKRFNRLMKEAHLRYPAADLDETIYRPERQLDTQTIERLSTCHWISQFPVSTWFDMFADNTYADACLTRITDKHHTYRLEMNGINMRETE